MITIITEAECVQFNLINYEREHALIRTLNYHRDNKTDKRIKVKLESDIFINPKDVIDVTFEKRKYDPKVGQAIDELIGELDK